MGGQHPDSKHHTHTDADWVDQQTLALALTDRHPRGSRPTHQPKAIYLYSAADSRVPRPVASCPACFIIVQHDYAARLSPPGTQASIQSLPPRARVLSAVSLLSLAALQPTPLHNHRQCRPHLPRQRLVQHQRYGASKCFGPNATILSEWHTILPNGASQAVDRRSSSPACFTSSP